MWRSMLLMRRSGALGLSAAAGPEARERSLVEPELRWPGAPPEAAGAGGVGVGAGGEAAGQAEVDELDAVGSKRGGGENESREVHRTMLELLNQLDGFTQNDDIKVICATNRPDILDPALLRSGRLDRKVELPLPNEEARARIMQIHSRKMNIDKEDVNFEELARSTNEFNGA